MKKIFFRADASSKVGLGHIMRCMALASMLREKFDCTFLLNNSSEVVFTSLEESNFSYIKLVSSELIQEAFEVMTIVQSQDILVIDGYQFNEEYFEQVKKSGLSLVLIDDFGNDSSNADVIINHAGAISKNTYKEYPHVQYCLGEKFAMLRPSFLKMAKEKKKISKVENVFICFGGADTHNITLKVLQAMNKIQSQLHFYVVLAPTFPFFRSIEEFLHNSALHVTIHSNLKAQEMAEIMNSSQVAIAPTSGLSYEICATGMGYLGGYYVNNQIGIHDGLLKRNCLVSIGDFTKVSIEEICCSFEMLVNDISQVKQLVKNQKKTMDGKSSEKFIQLFSSL